MESFKSKLNPMARVMAFAFALTMSACTIGKFKATSATLPNDPGTVQALDLENGGGEPTLSDSNQSASNSKNSRPPFVTALWDTHTPDAEEWTLATLEAIEDHGASLLTEIPDDVKTFCPNYSALELPQREAFWVFLISAMAAKESSFDPKQDFVEDFKDSNGNKVVSRGLLQISKESANEYGCDISNAQDLYDPKINLSCGVRILNRWISKDGVIAQKNDDQQWRGLARYWAVLRTTDTRKYISTNSTSLLLCHTPPRATADIQSSVRF